MAKAIKSSQRLVRAKMPDTNQATEVINREATNSNITIENISPDNLPEQKTVETNDGQEERKTGNDTFVKNHDDRDAISVRLAPSPGDFKTTPDLLADKRLFKLINIRTVDFNRYKEFIDEILTCNIVKRQYKPPYSQHEKELAKNRLPFPASAGYSLIKFATEKFVKATADLNDDYPDPAFNLAYSPYYNSVLERISDYRRSLDSQCEPGLSGLVEKPILVEAIWNYFIELGMTVQTMNAISRRFQNISTGKPDRLANLALAPLQPASYFLWGHAQDARNRSTLPQRDLLYLQQYGISLMRGSHPNINAADTRNEFMGAFNGFLFRCSEFLKISENLTCRANASQLLFAIREVHTALAMGANNSYSGMPFTSRVEMLVDQYLLSRSEIREFLGGRVMVPYPEPWMDRVDTMKSLQGWTPTSINYFYDCAVIGERIILSLRLGNWSSVRDSDWAAQWVLLHKDLIQQYIHSYCAITGIDLSNLDQASARRDSSPALLNYEKYLRESSYVRR